MDTTTRVLIADSGEDFRRMLAEVIDREEDLQVVGTAGDGQEALALAESLRPDVLVTDLVLARLDIKNQFFYVPNIWAQALCI